MAIKKNSITQFVLRTLLALLPVAVFVAVYAAADPFHILRSVTAGAGGRDSVQVSNNAGFMSVETYLAHNATERYNAFIFGSSMSQNFRAADWKRHLPDSARVLHFDASSETLQGIINKMRFLNDHGSRIDYALIIMEEAMLQRAQRENDMLYIQHPAVSGAHNWFRFHSLYLNAFRNVTQVGNALFPGRFSRLMQAENMAEEEDRRRIDLINETYYARADSLIAVNPDEFFTPQVLAAREHPVYPVTPGPSVDDDALQRLLAIRQILRDNRTAYIVIVPPCNFKPTLKAADLATLKRVFGANRVHDFSNYAPMVRNERCYYDSPGHLTAACCKLLLDSAYRTTH